MNYPYLFQTQYADHTGIFGAATLEEATILAWSSIEPLLSNPDPKLLTVTPMTQEMIDRFPDKAFLAKLQPYQPWKLYPFHIVKQCYHHPQGKVEPYNHRSLLRKPDIGMLAIAEVDAYKAGVVVDWDNSLFVGDRPEDEECAKRAGIRFIWADEFFERQNADHSPGE